MLLNPVTVTGTETVVWQVSMLGTEKLICAASIPIPTKKLITVKGKVLSIFFEFIGLSPIHSGGVGSNLNRLSEKIGRNARPIVKATKWLMKKAE
jgi:hypothetical protein